MSSSADIWSPGQSPTYHPEGTVLQHPLGPWYVRADGRWRLMTDDEVRAHLGAAA